MPGKLERFDKVIGSISKWFNAIAICAMVVMLVVVVVDVAGAKIFRTPLPGAFDVPSLLGLLIIALAIPQTYRMNGHVKIEFFAERMKKRTQAVLRIIVSLVTLVLFGAITWQMFLYSRLIQSGKLVTVNVEIPVFPFTYIAGLAFLLMCPLVAVQLIRAVAEVRSK